MIFTVGLLPPPGLPKSTGRDAGVGAPAGYGRESLPISGYEFQVIKPSEIKLPACFCGGQILKLAKHCFANLVVHVNTIKLPDVFQIPY